MKYKPSASEDKWVVGIVPTDASDLYLIPITLETVGQYVSVVIDGTLIFEGDLLKDTLSTSGTIYEVVRDDYRFKLRNFYDSCYDTPADAFSEGLDRFKLVGNRYDNPEMASNYKP